MLKHVEYVIGRLLIEALHGDKLGQNGRKRINAGKQSVAGMWAKHQLLQFIGYAFSGYLRQQSLVFQHPRYVQGSTAYPSSALKRQGSQDAQRIFGEPLMGDRLLHG